MKVPLAAAVFVAVLLSSSVVRSEVTADDREFYRTLANVTLDRYMDLISMPQVPSRYIAEEDQQNVSFPRGADFQRRRFVPTKVGTCFEHYPK